LRDLLNKPDWTAEENRIVLDYLETGEVSELVALLKERFEAGLIHNVPEDAERVAQLLSELHRRMNPEPTSVYVHHLPLRRRWGWAAAAAALILIFSGTYFIYKNRDIGSPRLAIVPVKTDVPPGGNKAVLTLANGSKIILDSAANGTLARQGNTKIIKTDSGRLIYTAAKEKPIEISYNTLSTPRGGQFQLILPDGTKVWLNSASTITYPTAFTGNNRSISISGEAYLEVAHNMAKPFIVSVAGQQVLVLGTHFNINSYPEEATTRTTLLEGSVRITKNGRHVLLKPGQQGVTANDPGTPIEVSSGVDLDNVMAWKNGIFEFNNLDFKSIMRQVSRWYDVDVQYSADPGLASFGGGISKQLTLLQVLHLLEGSGLHLTLDHKTIIVNK